MHSELRRQFEFIMVYHSAVDCIIDMQINCNRIIFSPVFGELYGFPEPVAASERWAKFWSPIELKNPFLLTL